MKYEALRKLVPSQKDVVLPEFSGVAAQLDAAWGELLTAVEEKGTSPSMDVAAPQSNITSLIIELNAHVENLNERFDEITKAVSQSDNERKRVQREACTAFEREFVHSHWSDIDAIHSHNREATEAQIEIDTLKKSQLSASVKERVAETFEALIASFFGKKYSFDRKRPV